MFLINNSLYDPWNIIMKTWKPSTFELITLSTISEDSLTFKNGNLQQENPQRNLTRQGKGLFDWIGLGTGHNVDPYLARTNQACLNGDLAECFKSRAIGTFADFFDQPEYSLSDQVKFVRMGRDVVQEVSRQPYEYSDQPR